MTEEQRKIPLSFTRATEAWWHQLDMGLLHNLHAYTEEIVIGPFGPNQDPGLLLDIGEFAIRWHPLGNPTPRLEMFSDCWALLDHPKVQGLLRWLQDHGDRRGKGRASPDEVCAALLELGFTDVTRREIPPEQEQLVELRKTATRILLLPDDDRLTAVTKLLVRKQKAEG